MAKADDYGDEPDGDSDRNITPLLLSAKERCRSREASLKVSYQKPLFVATLFRRGHQDRVLQPFS